MKRVLFVFLLTAACNNGGAGVTNESDGGVDIRWAQDVAVDAGAPDIAVSPDTQPEQVQPADLGEGDTGPDTVGPACDPGEGCFLDPCTENSQCQSGWCVEHMGEGVCTQPCQEDCPDGWTCRQVGDTEPDVVFICVSLYSNLCKPCQTSDGCKAVGGAEDVCVDYGDEGSFCGGPCGEDQECPWGFTCQETLTVDGIETSQCVADSGVCPCTAKSVTLGLWTPCEQANEWGVCGGKRVCTEDGLSDCDAGAATEEVCDGADNDCDEEIDEPGLVEGDYVDLCDDGNECTADICLGEDGCDHEALSEGECKDGNPCTLGDHCEEGSCVGLPINCDDQNPCTDDACNEMGGCVNEFNTLPCDDGDPCTLGDHCSEGSCSGQPVSCDCQSDADCADLEDDDICNGVLHCDKGLMPYQCAVVEDSQITCPQPTGIHAICREAACNPQTGACSMAPVNEGLVCDDGDPCTVGEGCANGLCSGGVPVICDDGNPCTDDSCDPATGCVYADNEEPCNDGNPCTVTDVCSGGACVGGQALACDDGNPCTDDACDPAVGCTHAANQAPCDDGNACTTGDVCSGGLCVYTGMKQCDDQNPCTDDVCDSVAGCVFTNNVKQCDDGDPCTIGDLCDGGACVSGPPAQCDDGNLCTDDSCEGGQCVHAPNQAPCDDANACTLDDACSDGACVGGQPLGCDDQNPCTDDICDPASGCVFKLNAQPCDDGDPCTVGDHCADGACASGGMLDCDDDNPCTTDACAADQGCLHTPDDEAVCDDGNACTEGDHCQDGACVFDDLKVCEDDNPCTTDLCNPAGGCIFQVNSAGCDDGDICTTGDTCHLGECISSGQLACDDGNPCTDDSCQSDLGCVHTTNEEPCDDGSVCSLNEHCTQGWCVPTGFLDCDDGNPCTDDTCDPVLGCVNLNNVLPCDDLDACTTTDTCADGVCVAGPDLDCDDENPCTDDSCDPDSGCVYSNNTIECDDEDECTVGEACLDGACVGGQVVVCNDNNVCTDDYCDHDTGCVFGANEAACDDDDDCTFEDHCSFGDCVGGLVVDCDDQNDCTDDTCYPDGGCDHTPVADNTPCNGGGDWHCFQGVCTDCSTLSGSQTFNYTGSVQSFIVPDCISSVTIEVWGAQGGGSNGQEDGGKGGYAKGDLAVTPGETLYVYVGEKGHNQSSGGWNGGGHGSTYGGGGGGASDVRQGGTNLDDRVIVGGGGAGGQTGGPDHGAGGEGGGLSGHVGYSYYGWTPGGGGTQNSGGSAGAQCYAGSFGNGGSHASYHVSGGGGGWYGGGCSYGGGGGGGSSYYGGCTNGSTQMGIRTGHGTVKISW